MYFLNSVETNEAYVEHEMATLLMKAIESNKDGDRREAQMKVLAESVEHHVEEEESEFLKDVKKDFSSDELQDMASEFIKLRKKSQKETGKDFSGILGKRLH